MAETSTVPIKELDELVRQAVRNIGYTNDDADTLTRVMMYAEVHGNNQGISKLYRPQDMGFNPKAGPLKFENETKLSCLVNGNQRAGMVALEAAVDKAIQKASVNGMAVTGTYNTYTSTGMLAYYSSRIAEKGMISLVLAGSPEMVAAVGGKEPVYGTNALSFAVPGPDTGPLVLDMATAATTLFGVISAKAAGTQLPPGVAVDENGKPTTDPDVALKGAFLAFGGYKGAGLSMMVELLTQALCNGGMMGGAGAVKAKVGTGAKWSAKSWANFVLAVDPALLMPLPKFKARVNQICKHVKASGDKVFLPGEFEANRRDKNLKQGTLTISKGLHDNIKKLATGGKARL